MRKPTTIATIAASFFAVCAGQVFADVAPPPDYVETCTVEKKTTSMMECLSCAAYYGDTARCERLLVPYCYAKVCKTRGASVWSEVLCRTKGAQMPAFPADVADLLPSASNPGPSPLDAGAVTMPASCTASAPSTATATTTPTTTATTTATASPTGKDLWTATQTTTGTTTATGTPSTTVVTTATGTTTATSTPSTTVVTTATGTATATGTPSTTVVATATGTATDTSTHGKDGSGCSVGANTAFGGALVPLLVGLALIAIRRRR